MSVDVEVETVIDQPLEKVAEYASDPANAPRWYRRIHSADWQTTPPVEVGSKITFRAKFLGRELVYTYAVTEFEPGKRLVMRTAEGPFPMTTTYTWQPAGRGATRMTLRSNGNPTGFSKLTVPFMARAMKRAMTQDLRSLKNHLERP